MADIFVSYAKADRSLAAKLAAMLEAEGWKVWWDTSLVIGDDFRNEIMTELGRARAVIVIWTDASIKSDWVRSEAGRAQADRKLIPVKLEHLAYKDLPPPFDVLHTENVGEEDKIRAAVVAQLAKPAVQPSALALLTKGFKYELLTWFGIVGGALTLFGNLDSVLKVADWARLLVQNWREWTHAFWVWVFGWLGIHLPPEWTPVFSFLLFGTLLIIGQAIQFNRTLKSQSIEHKYETHQGILLHFKLHNLLPILVFFLFWILFGSSLYKDIIANNRIIYRSIPFPILRILPYLCSQIVVLGTLIKMARYNGHVIVLVSLLTIFWMIITVNQFQHDGEVVRLNDGSTVTLRPPSLSDFYEFVAIATMAVLPFILLSVAPAKAISRRLIFLALGLLLLIALNELSKLGFDLTAPKLQG
jgi:hypothetical protein